MSGELEHSYNEIWPREAFSKKSGRPISVAFQSFADIIPEHHDKVPYNIDGKRVIVVPKILDGPKISRVHRSASL